ncbi:MAG: hypothetical protein Q9170_007094 [Blastenia crenularia]
MNLSEKPATADLQQDEPIVYTWTVQDRCYEVRASTFTKRQLRPHETTLNRFGEVSQYAFNTERLENERDALIFISQNTTIPVPRFVNWSVDDDGVASLVVELLDGRMMDWLMNDLLDGVQLTGEEKTTLQRNVDSFVEDTVLPQLGDLRSKMMGQLGGVLFSPPAISEAGPRFTKAPLARHATTERYVYCHNDLAPHNIVIKPDSLEVLCLIDWEYSGFFPPGFEVPFWRCRRVEGEWTHENGHLVDFESRKAMLKESGNAFRCLFVPATLGINFGTVDEMVEPKQLPVQPPSYSPSSRFPDKNHSQPPILQFFRSLWSCFSSVGSQQPSHRSSRDVEGLE